jgi:hypothetical protein
MRAPARYKSPLDRAVRCAGPREYEAMKRVLKQAGINDRTFGRWVDGENAPVGWIARLIADALGTDVAELWPRAPKRERKDPERDPWRPAR